MITPQNEITRKYKKTLLELGQQLIEMDDLIKELEELDDDTKDAFRRLAFALEHSIDEITPELSLEIHKILDDVIRQFQESAPELAEVAGNVKSICQELNI